MLTVPFLIIRLIILLISRLIILFISRLIILIILVIHINPPVYLIII